MGLLTIAQNSMHGCFGASGDLCAVPPKAATIGPAEVIAAKHRIDQHAIRVDGSRVSWQRMTTRLVLHGPVTPAVAAIDPTDIAHGCLGGRHGTGHCPTVGGWLLTSGRS